MQTARRGTELLQTAPRHRSSSASAPRSPPSRRCTACRAGRSSSSSRSGQLPSAQRAVPHLSSSSAVSHPSRFWQALPDRRELVVPVAEGAPPSSRHVVAPRHRSSPSCLAGCTPLSPPFVCMYCLLQQWLSIIGSKTLGAAVVTTAAPAPTAGPPALQRQPLVHGAAERAPGERRGRDADARCVVGRGHESASTNF